MKRMAEKTGKRMAEKFGAHGFRVVLAAVIGVSGMLSSAGLRAQEKIASIHGHVNNAAGLMVPDATVRLTAGHTTDPKTVKWAYTFPVDANGDYKGAGIAPGTYIVVVVSKDVTIDYFTDQTFKASEDKLVNFDMQRKEFIDKMTPEQKKALEEYKKNTAETIAANKTVANLNTLLKQAREAIAAGKFTDALTAMTTATQQDAGQPVLWLTMGESQLGVADDAAKAAKAAGTPQTDPAVTQKYTDAAASFKKAGDLSAAAKKPAPEVTGGAYEGVGKALGKAGDLKGASDAMDSAAKANPAAAGRYYTNLAVILFNAGKGDDAAAAADKAIAADPKKADAYYIKAQALIPKASVDPKTNKVTAPPGCEEAYQMYLELAPDGPHAAEVKEILTGIGATVRSTYKAGKKS